MSAREFSVDYLAGAPDLAEGVRHSRADRTLDLAALIVLFPVLIVVVAFICIAVFLDSPGSVFYRARRVGLGGKPFTMFKFRTMRSGSTGSSITAAGDDRITPLGRFLRASRLDELPQLWNVVRGEMRLVGPRPELEEFVRLYQHEYERILEVPPGVTGPTQIQFAVEEALLLDDRDRVSVVYARRVMPRKIASDLAYLRSRTLAGDCMLIARTLLLPLQLAADRLFALLRGRPTAVLVAGGGLMLFVFAFLAASGPPR